MTATVVVAFRRCGCIVRGRLLDEHDPNGAAGIARAWQADGLLVDEYAAGQQPPLTARCPHSKRGGG